MQRTNLKVFRIKMQLSQAAISEKIGCQRSTFAAIENGKRNGRQAFWNGLQAAFNLPNEVMWELMKVDTD